MVGVLGDRHGDRKRETVATAGDETRRHWGRLDARAATEAVLLADVLRAHELARDDVNLLALFRLPHLLERAATCRARAIRVVELVALDDEA